MVKKAQPINPRKKFRYRVEIEGLDDIYVQKCNIPKLELRTTEHIQGDTVIETVGKKKWGDLTLSKLVPACTSDFWGFKLLLEQSSKCNQYFTMNIIHEDPNGKPLEFWKILVCPKSWDSGDGDKTSDDNMLEEVVFSVAGVELEKSLRHSVIEDSLDLTENFPRNVA